MAASSVWGERINRLQKFCIFWKEFQLTVHFWGFYIARFAWKQHAWGKCESRCASAAFYILLKRSFCVWVGTGKKSGASVACPICGFVGSFTGETTGDARAMLREDGMGSCGRCWPELGWGIYSWKCGSFVIITILITFIRFRDESFWQCIKQNHHDENDLFENVFKMKLNAKTVILVRF